jgi:signal transduction histidine kinase/CheY-like chemotaxis protein
MWKTNMATLFVIFILAVCVDLVRRYVRYTRKTEINAQDEQAFAAAIQDALREPLLVLGGELRVVSANRAFYQLFQLSEGDVLAKDIFGLADGAWDTPQLRALLADIQAQGRSLDGVDVELNFPKLGRRNLRLNARKLRREGDGSHRILLAIEDVSELKQVAESGILLKNQFLSALGHELRTPLNAVLGFCELLADETSGTLNDRQRRYLAHIRSGGQRLLQQVSDVLDLARIETRRVELAQETLVVEPVFAEVMEGFRSLANQKSLAVSHTVEPNLAVRADASRLRQILVNLLANAIHSTPTGGRVGLLARRESSSVRFEVRDTGPGIPPEEQEKIFEAFHRVPRSGTASQGTGLDLAITQRLVELHGGKLGLESKVGQGSCFYFNLPAADGVRAPALPERQEAPPQGEAPLVLVAESDPATIQLIQTQLTWAGYGVVVCDEAQAFQLALERRPAAISLDILMKPLIGGKLLAQLRADPRTRDIPVIVTSGLAQPGAGISLVAEEYLVKPILKKTLLAAVERCLDRRGSVMPVRPILLVDDDPITRELVAEMLTSQGYTVASAEDGLQARALVAATLPELVLLDLVLPKLSGFELLAEWRANPRTKDMPVFVLSGKELTPQELAYLQQHSELLLRKQDPWQLTLIDHLRSALAISPEETDETPHLGRGRSIVQP